MPVTRMNHAVIYVRDLESSLAFWRGLLEFDTVAEIPARAAFLRAPGSTNDHDLGIFALGAGLGDTQAGITTVGLYHLAFEVDTLAELARLASVMSTSGHLVGASDHSTTKSLYVKDPDGIEIELCWIVPAALIDADALANKATTRALDLAGEIARYGAETRGGVGVSIPA